MTEHLGYEKHDPAGQESGNIRNGTRAETVLTESTGHVEIEVCLEGGNLSCGTEPDRLGTRWPPGARDGSVSCLALHGSSGSAPRVLNASHSEPCLSFETPTTDLCRRGCGERSARPGPADCFHRPRLLRQ